MKQNTMLSIQSIFMKRPIMALIQPISTMNIQSLITWTVTEITTSDQFMIHLTTVLMVNHTTLTSMNLIMILKETSITTDIDTMTIMAQDLSMAMIQAISMINTSIMMSIMMNTTVMLVLSKNTTPLTVIMENITEHTTEIIMKISTKMFTMLITEMNITSSTMSMITDTTDIMSIMSIPNTQKFMKNMTTVSNLTIILMMKSSRKL